MDGRAFYKHSAPLEPGSDKGRPRALLRKSLLEGGISGGQGTAAPTGPFIFSGQQLLPCGQNSGNKLFC